MSVYGGTVTVQSATKIGESAAPETAGHKPAAAAKKGKLSVFLITGDDMLWPQIGPHLGPHFILKQVDSIDELLSSATAGQPAVILWDARDQDDAAAVFSRLQLHSARFAVVALDDARNAHAWTNPIALRQVIAQVAVPIAADSLKSAIESAQEEVNARSALLGGGDENVAGGRAGAAAGASGVSGARSKPSDARRIPWVPAAAILAVLAGAGVFLMLRHHDAPPAPVVAVKVAPAPPEVAKAPVAADEKVDLLIEKAQQAMQDRHFIDPAEGSALALYRNAMRLDPGNGEARQGLQRLAEILYARVQSALDERKIDVALQSLETVRSIDPSDARLAPLDERIAAMRAEFGPAQILAAINAQNFDRAAQLIDDAARSKLLGTAKLAQLREELRRRHEDSDVANFVKLIDTRLSQDKVIEPRGDSAAYYLAQARAAGANAAALQGETLEINKRVTAVMHAIIEQKRYADADRMITDMRTGGVSPVTIATLQHDLTAARSALIAATPEQPQYVDPRVVQAQILDQARAALDAKQTARAESLLQMAGGLGASSDMAALNERLLQTKLAAAGDAPLVAEAALTRVKGIQPDYPERALSDSIEGWVELSFVVTAEGKVTKAAVLDSNPKGIFDSAALRAISRARYQPWLQGGKPTAVNTKLRIAFHLSHDRAAR
jgi:TonB family protein